MPDDLPDLHTPLPDRAHEMLRQATEAAIAKLEDQFERVQDTYLLLLAAAGGMQGTLNVVQTATTQLTQAQAALAALGQQVAAINVRLDADRIRDETAQGGIDGLQDAVAALTARVDALEQQPSEVQ